LKTKTILGKVGKQFRLPDKINLSKLLEKGCNHGGITSCPYCALKHLKEIQNKEVK